MKKEITFIGTSLLLLVSTMSQADDSAEMTNARIQQQSHMQSMSVEERALYQQLNGGGDGEGNGNMNRYRKGDGSGSGNKNRYGQAESSGYGTGYSSRQGNGSGGGKGRGH
jgi:hypothetical protein